MAQSVPLSPRVADATSSSPRYRSPLRANVDRTSGPSITDQQLQSERCASLKASIDWVKNNPTDPRNRGDANRQNFLSHPWGASDSHSSLDRQNELERQSMILGCPNGARK